MKSQFTFTKIFITVLFVLGFALPAAAEQIPQPFKSVDTDYADWWDEFDDQDINTTQVPAHKKQVEYSLSESQNQSYDNDQNKMVDMHDYPMPEKQGDSSWMINGAW